MKRIFSKIKFFKLLWWNLPIHFWLSDGNLRTGYILLRRTIDGNYSVEELATATFDRNMKK